MTHSRLARIAGFLLIFFAASCAGGRGWAESPTVGAATEAGTDLATGFQEPLIATAPTSTKRTTPSGAPPEAIASKRAGGDFSALEAFLAEHPQSGWRVALLADLGFAYLHNGYFSRTIEA
jgi:hypothetical protein